MLPKRRRIYAPSCNRSIIRNQKENNKIKNKRPVSKAIQFKILNTKRNRTLYFVLCRLAC